ncbi:MAG: chondroitinase-B domain-containing protein, partial [Actinomycetes bacterium]
YEGDVTISGKQNLTIEGAAETEIIGSLIVKNCANVIIRGLSFPEDREGDTVQFRGTSHHCALWDCKIGPTSHPGSAASGESGTYVFVGDNCHNIRIEWNELRNKSRSGNGIRVYGDFDTYRMCQHVLIAHNDIHDFYPAVVNDFEPIRLGVSSMSRTDTNSVVERNVITAIRSEPEVISLKAGKIRCTGNVLAQCAGGPVIRHGRGSILADNYVIDGQQTENDNGELSGGPRFYDSDHEVAYNTMQGLAGTNYQAALLLDTGDAENDGDSLSNHWRVIRAKVHHNVLAECATSIQVGNNYSDAPKDCTVTDNLVAASGEQAVTFVDVEPGTIGTVASNAWHATATAAG